MSRSSSPRSLFARVTFVRHVHRSARRRRSLPSKSARPAATGADRKVPGEVEGPSRGDLRPMILCGFISIRLSLGARAFYIPRPRALDGDICIDRAHASEAPVGVHRARCCVVTWSLNGLSATEAEYRCPVSVSKRPAMHALLSACVFERKRYGDTCSPFLGFFVSVYRVLPRRQLSRR